MKTASRKFLAAIILVIFMISLTACDNEKSVASAAPYIKPIAKFAEYDVAQFKIDSNMGIYVDKLADGYVCAMGKSNEKLKFQVKHGDEKYNYDLDNTGIVEVFPLQMGDGKYTLSVFEHLTGDQYVQVLSVECDVKLSSEFEPFLRPNQMVNYEIDGEITALSNKITADAVSEADAVEKIYKYITENIAYDKEFAERVIKEKITGYVPKLDEIVKNKKGICSDYASLSAALMRAQGIPAKVITGYVSPSNAYHAWNMIYLKDIGWTYKKISFEKNEWNLMDTTFDAATTGANMASLVGDGKNYSQKLVY